MATAKSTKNIAIGGTVYVHGVVKVKVEDIDNTGTIIASGMKSGALYMTDMNNVTEEYRPAPPPDVHRW